MAGESVNRRREASADAVAEEDYQSFSEALGSSARGRAFLAEYARRNRHADTEAVLGALTRLEETAIRKSGSVEADRIRQDLRALLDTLRTARPQTENSPTAIKAATLAALIDFTQARIEAVVGMPEGLRDIEPVVAVPQPDEPELPIPHPSAAAPGPIMALVHTPPKTVERTEEKPNIAVTNEAVVAPLTRVRELTGIPKVEFDYAAHQAARPTQARAPQTEEGWSTLAPPAVATPPQPTTQQPVQRAPEPVAAPIIEKPVEIAAPMAVIETPLIDMAPPVVEAPSQPTVKAAPETYELWLDEPAAAETVTVAEVSLALPDAEFVAAAPVVSAPVAQAAAPVSAPATPAPAMTAIEALVQQMEKSQPPAPVQTPVVGKADVVDPLMPLMALSEEERIALFT